MLFRSKKPSAALVRGIDAFNHWEHDKLPEVEFDAVALQGLRAARAEFFSRGRNG